MNTRTPSRFEWFSVKTVALVVAAVTVAVLLRAALDPYLGSAVVPFVTVLAAVAAVTLYVGVGYGLFAAVVGYLAADYLFIVPRGSFNPGGLPGIVALVVYLASCGVIMAVAEGRRRAQRQAFERWEQLRVTLASIGDAVITTDTEGCITELNGVAEALTGWSAAEARGQPLEKVFHIVNEHTREPVESPAQKALQEGVIVGLANHTVLIRKDGTELPIDDSAAPIRDQLGHVVGCVLVFRDVTARRRAEQALRDSEQQLADFFENANYPLHWAGPDGIILRANRAELEMLGYTHEEYVGHHIAEFHDDRELIDDMFVRLHAGESLYEQPARMRCKDGSIKHVLIACTVRSEAGRFVHTRCLTRDVTESTRAEELRKLLAAIVTDSDDAIVSKDLTGKILTWNAGAERVFGYTADEAIGQSIHLVIPPDLRDEERTILARLGRGERVDRIETQRVTKQGRRIDVSLTISPIRDSSGRVVGASKVGRDITERKQAENELRRLAARERLITDALPALISYVDAERRYRFTNRGYLEWFGQRREQLEGAHVREVMGNTAYERLRPHVEAALSGRQVQFEDEIPSAGGPRFVRAEYVPDVEHDGSVAGFYALITDMSERRRMEQALRESEARFRALAENIPQLAWMCRPDGWIFWYNRRWFDYTGTSLEQMQGWGWQAVHDPDHVQRVTEGFERALAHGEPWSDTFPLRGSDGQYRWFLSRAFPIRDAGGEVTLWFGTNTDITELLTAQQALREADRRKDEFLATLAHELRNPLAPILSALELLERADGDITELVDLPAILERHVTHMVRLVDDLLDVSRITRDKLELRRTQVELAEVVQHAVEATRALYERDGEQVQLSLPDEPLYLKADPVRLAQVFSNLLNNACKYSPEGGTIQLHASADDGHVSVSVKDNGIGIPPDSLERIFEMFSQVDRTLERARGGLGIGLTLVKRLVEMHGGTITARSEGLGHGSEFVVRLPLVDPPPEQPTATQQPSEGRAERRRVLVVDDNEDSAALLAMLLQRAGHETRTVHDGLAALDEAERFRPDLILLDIGLPKLNGFDVCRRVREQAWGREITMVALTGWGQEEDRRRSREAGFDRHLVKPVDHDGLVEVLGSRSR